MDDRIEIRQDFYWNGDTMITDIVGKIAGDMAKKREESVLNHFETDYSELREYLEAKRQGKELAPVVRCKDCKHWKPIHEHIPHMECQIFCGAYEHGYPTNADDFCSYGERKDA